MAEAKWTCNGVELTEAQAMTVRCALEAFASDLRANGLGDDEHGRTMTAGYLARIEELRGLQVPARLAAVVDSYKPKGGS